MKAELFTCEGLSKNNCLSKSYCGWCIENTSSFCKSMNACDFTNYNTSNTSVSLVCEIGYHKYRCFIEKAFMVLLIIVLVIVCVFILVDVIKSRMKKLLKAEYSKEPYESTYESLPNYESVQDNENNRELQNVADEKTSLLTNSDKINIVKETINSDNLEETERINKIVNVLGSRISIIMFASTILPTMLLYYSNIFLFLVDIFLFIIFVLLICIFSR